MVTVMQPFMDVESCRSYVDELYSAEPERCLEAIVCLKNSVIGSNRQKGAVIAGGVVPRLMQLLNDNSTPLSVREEAAVTLGSLARGTPAHVKQLIDLGLAPLVLTCILDKNETKLTEACLRCARSLFSHSSAPIDLLFKDSAAIAQLLNFAKTSISNQICVTTILSSACRVGISNTITNRIPASLLCFVQNLEHQMTLCEQGAVQTLAVLLFSKHNEILMPTINCLTNLAFQNKTASETIVNASHQGKNVLERLVVLMSCDKPCDMQLAAARCMTCLHRAGAIPASHPNITFKTLPTLVGMCRRGRSCEERIAGAENLAYLAEVDTELQRLASISNQLIPNLSHMLHAQSEANNNSLPLDHQMASTMKQAAFKAFASLGANDEDIRKKIIETESLMEDLVQTLEDRDEAVRLAAVRCLHSLSRSVQQLRTTFLDHSVWRPLMVMLHSGASEDILTVASSTLCNLLLEFSPAKEPMLEQGAVQLLCSLTHRPDPALRLNGVWALMNMAFQADHKLKSQILSTIGTDHIFRLLSDAEVNVLMKTLGLLRNLLSTKSHIDQIMALHGIQIMQAVSLILESNHSAEVKEQALCILANIADGDSGKDYIMCNDEILKKLQEFLTATNVKLQIAAIFCISNLVWKEEGGALDRQAKLKEMGVLRILQQLIMTSDTVLFDKVKTVITQFPEA